MEAEFAWLPTGLRWKGNKTELSCSDNRIIIRFNLTLKEDNGDWKKVHSNKAQIGTSPERRPDQSLDRNFYLVFSKTDKSLIYQTSTL